MVLVVGGQRERAARALGSLLDQSVSARMEILLFDLGPEGSLPLPESDRPNVKMTRLSPADLLGAARARGVREAQAPVVAFLEEHCEMRPGWAEAMIAHHRGSWAAVVSDFTVGNPDAGASDVCFRITYGDYIRPQEQAGVVSSVATQNSAFKRDVLLSYEPDLELMLTGDLILQLQMQRDGHRFYYDPSVKIAHRSENTFRSLAVGVFLWSWGFSNIRANFFRWSLFRRAIWIALAPLIPWVRLTRRIVRSLRRRDVSLVQLLRDLPFVFGIDCSSAAGQVVGLVTGAERGIREFSHFEMNEPRRLRSEMSK